MGIFCSYVDECGFCEVDGICRNQCFDDLTSCSQKRTLCGTCVVADRDCGDGDACTLDYCTEGTCCEHAYIAGCRCDESNCNTTDLCFPKQCDENSEHSTTNFVECPVTDDCLYPYCEGGGCLCVEITTTTTTSIITSEATTTSIPTTSTITSLPTTTTSATTSTTLNPTTISTFSPTTISTMSTTTTMPTTSPSTTSTTFIPTTTTDLTTVSHTTELSTIYSSTIGATSSTTTTGSTLPPRPMAVCYENIDCPPHYCCYQISRHSYTFISKYFEDQCSPDRLKIF
ncbi:hypothetical protein DDB_G0275605 [Dictyostelium discoideum AX4]|uniref:Uncharacterized protein n=1 Tax=Dictyostelium discoideum TaxID=44689 RepID=Q86H76_DICDI|nr:hypothetical protein DDB_G0275605 [Dictyostelium discoideum AX4]EAL69553.1 hypothetical protein DDB_G0275605 [Dictyostelium discoideum AX4]|eukprot:XP_643439.1 hypothetical protein DDB_G0275605 [Dictyostelium discoideum AX4]